MKIDKEFELLIKATNNNMIYSPWFKTQSIKDYFVTGIEEEVIEIKQAIENNDIENLKEELGDALWDILSLIKICEKDYDFTLEDVAKRFNDKFKERKPHLYEERHVTYEEESEVWHSAKAKQKAEEKVIKND